MSETKTRTFQWEKVGDDFLGYGIREVGQEYPFIERHSLPKDYATLIEAAPAMLEALRDCADTLDAVAACLPQAKVWATRSVVTRARATIAQATSI